MHNKRSTFSGKLGFVLSAAGASVGLGNIWRFPYLAAKYGGGIFLLIYIVLALTFGYTMIIAETTLGRMTKKSPVGAFHTFAKTKFASFSGWINAIIPILIVPYYSVIGGWVIKYLFEYLKGDAKLLATDTYFSNFISNGVSTEICFILFTFFTLAIIYAGVQNGIERVSKFMMPVLVVLSVIIAGYSISRPGAFEGVKYFLIPNFEEIYADNTIQTPLITKILIFLSHLIRDDFILIIGIIVLIIGGFIYFKKNSQKFNEILNKLYFKTPLVKTFNQLIITNKFVKALSILISSGVQIVYSIETSAKVMDNDYIYQKIRESNELIKKGNSIGSSLKKVEELPSLFLSMVVIGEESGRLDNILGTVSEYYENELDSKLERGTKYFENFLTLFIGIIVGIAVISMMMPMFDAVASI